LPSCLIALRSLAVMVAGPRRTATEAAAAAHRHRREKMAMRYGSSPAKEVYRNGLAGARRALLSMARYRTNEGIGSRSRSPSVQRSTVAARQQPKTPA
jgi:hypothetical protein